MSVCPVVARFAQERVQPLVKKMDEESQMDPSIISDMFNQGVSEAIMLTLCRVYVEVRGGCICVCYTVDGY